MQRAISIPPSDLNAIEYLAGYAYKRLVSFHKEECATCFQYGEHITKDTREIRASQYFTCLKRYKDTQSKLFTTSEHFRDFTRHIVQLAAFCFQQNLEDDGLVKKVVLSAQTHLANLPIFCSNMEVRIMSLLARAKITNMVKLRNSELKKIRKGRKVQKSNAPENQKLRKLSHL